MALRRWCKRKYDLDKVTKQLAYPCYGTKGFTLIGEACDKACMGSKTGVVPKNGPNSRPKLSIGYRILFALAQKGMPGLDQTWKEAMMPDRYFSNFFENASQAGPSTRGLITREPSIVRVSYTPPMLIEFLSIFKASWVSA